MYDLLRLLKDAIGTRALVPVLLIVGLGLGFKTVRDYPVRELFYDRYYLITALAIAFVAAANAVWTSAATERTPQGRYGVYVARIRGDGPNRPIQNRLLEGISANLAAKAIEAQIRLEIRDLNSEISDLELESLPTIATKLNAAIIVWGTAIDERTLYSRLWSQRGGVLRSATPLNVSDISPLADFASLTWQRLSDVLQQDAPSGLVSEQDLAREVQILRAEVAELRTRIAAGTSVRSPGVFTDNLSAVLVGIGDYGGQADLAGPANDVAALQAALRARNKSWKTTVLLDRAVTAASVQEMVRSQAAAITADATLLVYLSGHIDPDEHGASKFFLSDIRSSIDVRDLIDRTLRLHPRTVFLIDGRFDSTPLSADELREAAVLSAESKGYAFEANIKGKSQGAFTAALVDVLQSVPQGTALDLRDVHSLVVASLRRTYKEAAPQLRLGTNPPTL